MKMPFIILEEQLSPSKLVLLNRKEIKVSLDEMIKRVKQAGAPSIGLTIYPLPDGYFANKIMNPVYSYQNGGDWTWFGARMIQQLIKYGFVEEAYGMNKYSPW